jgi:guanylate kinase
MTCRLFVVSAPSGAGKTSLVAALLERDAGLVVSVSHTTRPRRTRERDGVNYHFTDPQTFAAMIERGEFLEHATVFGHQYGPSAATVASAHARGRDVILEIDWQGAAQVRSAFVDAISIFILPPSMATLERRLVERGQDAPEVIARRLAAARAELSHALEFDYLVVNDDFESALEALSQIVGAERNDRRAPIDRPEALVGCLLSAS